MLKLEDLGFGNELLKNVEQDSGESSEEQKLDRKIEIDNRIGGDTVTEADGHISAGDETKDKSNGEGENGNEDRVDDRDADVSEDEGNEVEAADENDVVRDSMLKKGAMRRSHMNFQAQKDESCKVCVCSVEGKDEYCSRRPAMNVNECLRMADIMENHQKNDPFDVTKVLAYRIRRGQGGSAFKNQGLCSAGDS